MEYNKVGVTAKTINTGPAKDALTTVDANAFDKSRIHSAYFADCGNSIGVQSPEGRSIVITDVIHGSVESDDGENLELAYKDSSSSDAASRTPFLKLAPRTSHSFNMPIMLPAGKFLNIFSGTKATICYYIV